MPSDIQVVNGMYELTSIIIGVMVLFVWSVGFYRATQVNNPKTDTEKQAMAKELAEVKAELEVIKARTGYR